MLEMLVPVRYEGECRVDGVAVIKSLANPVRLQDPPRPQDVLRRILGRRFAPLPNEVHHCCLKANILSNYCAVQINVVKGGVT